MVEVIIRGPVEGPPGKPHWPLNARILVGEGTFDVVENYSNWPVNQIKEMSVLDLESGNTLSFNTDPIRWAQNLPGAFRTGDIICIVQDIPTGQLTLID